MAPPVRPPRRGPANPEDTLADHERETIKGVPPIVAPKPPSGSSVNQNLDFLRGDSALDASGAFPTVSGSSSGLSGSSKSSGGSSKKSNAAIPVARSLSASSSNVNPFGGELDLPTSPSVPLTTSARFVKKEPPKWIWFALGGGAFLVVLLLAIVLLTRL
ncbi:MAG: hypothetical protein QM811_15905 [Pirellulales bacterium]